MPDDSRTVLIVDDEPQILLLVQRMLQARKVKILVAPRPSEALRICEEEPVHLLISDVDMPEMPGNKLAERVLKLRPEAAVLLMSGVYDEAPRVAAPGKVRFLKKPFFPADMVKMLGEMLG
jgi:two-component system, cell cycle sensor histidine kinase and response regulator CckA